MARRAGVAASSESEPDQSPPPGGGHAPSHEPHGREEVAQIVQVMDGVRRSLCAGLMSPTLAADLEERMQRSLRKSFAAAGGSDRGGRAAGGADGALALALGDATVRHASRSISIREVGEEVNEAGDGAASERRLAVGRVSLPIQPPLRPELVPDIYFTDNAMHLRMLEVCRAWPATLGTISTWCRTGDLAL